MDKELKSLMDQLRSVSAIDTAKRLNDRNVIDVLMQLVKNKQLVGVYTTDGKEFVTRQELLRSLEDEVEVHGGRLNTIDLPALLGVDMRHIESVVPEYLADRKDDVSVMNGEIFTEQYFQGVVEECLQRLQTETRVIISDAARRLQLPTQHLHSLLEKGVPPEVGVIEENILSSAAYIATQKATVRGAARGALVPVSMVALAERLQMPTSALCRVMEALIAGNELEGELVGGVRGQFVPATYVRARDRNIHDFYSQNGFVDYAYLRAAGVVDGAAFMSQRYGISISGVGTAGSTAPTSSTGNNSNKGGKRVKKGAGSKDDKSKSQQSSDDAPVTLTAKSTLSGLPLSSCFVSDRVLLQCVPVMEELGEDCPVAALAASLPPCIDVTADADLILRRLGLECPCVMEASVTASALRLVHKGSLEHITNHVRSLASHEDVRGTRKLILVTGKLLRVDVEDDDNEGLVKEVLALLAPTIDGVYEHVRAQQAMSETQKAKQLQAEHDRQGRALWHELHQYEKGIAAMGAQPALAAQQSAVQRAVLLGPVTRMVRVLLFDLLWAHDPSNVTGFPPSGVADETAFPNKKLKEAFPKGPATAVAESVLSTLKLNTVRDAIEHLEKMSASAEVHIALRAPGRKDDKECLAAMGSALVSEIKTVVAPDNAATTVADVAAALTKLVALIYQQKNKGAILVPGKCVAAVAGALEDDELVSLQGAVQSALASKGPPGVAVADLKKQLAAVTKKHVETF
eukprot:PhM_4_TR16894/c0_g1_i1/m.12037